MLPSNVISLPLVGKNRGHPAVFPVDLPLFFINLLCPPDGLVVDPFAGSGTTGIAALSEGRRCVLIDNNPDYCQLALRRLREETVVSKSNGRYATVGTGEGPQIKLLDPPQSVSGTAPKLRSVRYALPKRKRVSKKREVASH